MVVLLTVPLVWVSVSEAPKPLPELVEISKLAGANAMMLPVSEEPETTNDCTAGETEAVPAQAVMVPVAVPAVMAGQLLTVTTALPVIFAVQPPLVLVATTV
jgi:hypothetical protein